MTITLYGIANCDTVKKARAWLDAEGIAYRFHDYKKQGADPAQIAGWMEVLGWEQVLNRSGTTFRKLPDTDKLDLDGSRAGTLMVANPSAIRRPIVEYPGGLLIGFRPEEWSAALH
ncbi:MAG: arsenate reductase [Novosphingobium sp.]